MLCRSLVVIFQLLWCGVGAGQTTVQPDPTQLAGVIEQARVHWNVPGLAVAIVKDGQVFLASGFGVRELGKPESVDGDTVFAIASNTKAFTAAAIAILEEEGKIRWDDPVQQHLPWLQLYDPYVSAEIRIDDLLCHRSGLGTYSGDLLWWGTPYTPEEVLRRIKHLPANGRFRVTYGYSNLMFLAAGEVIRQAGGKSWPEFIQERILSPVGMTRTVTSVKSLDALSNVACPHKPTLENVSPIPWYNWDTMAAAGGIISSANDMAKWLRVLLDHGQIDNEHRLFSTASSRKMWTLHTVLPFSEAAQKRSPTTHFKAYGLGWSLSDYKGRMTVSHGGGYDGMYSHVLLVPEDKLGIVVLTNSMTGISPALVNTIMDEFLGGEKIDWLTQGRERDLKDRAAFYQRIKDTTTPKVEGTQPSRDQQAYVGTYRSSLYGEATVGVEDDKLVLRLKPNSQLVADLTHLHYDTWVIHWRQEFAWFAEGTIQFVPDGHGVFQELRLDIPNDDLWFDELKLMRVSPASPR